LNRPRVAWFVFAALLVAGLAGLVWKSTFRPAWRLPDGTRLTLAGITYGTNHPSPLKHVWERWPLPASVAGWLPSEGWPVDRPGFGPELRIWFRTDRNPAPGESYRWDLTDEAGLTVADFGALQLGATNGATGLRLDFGAFPRQGKSLRLVGRHFDPTNQAYQPVLELELPNPRPRPAGAGAGPVPALPQTARDGPLEFTLVAFETGLARHSGFARTPAPPGEEPTARLDFLARSSGVPNRDWFPLNVRIADPEGHALSSYPIDWLGSQNGWVLKVQSAPWAGQAWRLRVEFSRNNEFAPGELVKFSGLRVGGQAGVAVDQRGRVGEREVELRFLRFGKPQDWEWKADARLVRRETGVSLTLVEARDQRDRKLWRHPRHLTFRAWPDSETVDLTFAVHSSRFGEFVAEPTDVRRR
jgi:hypothetical protein